MPFSQAFEDIYELAIRPACEAAGAYAERVDKQIFSGSIMERLYNQIARADILIADVSNRNPNVFYEVGYAHALGKSTILITKTEEDIPFDLRQYPHIIYGESLTLLRAELERRIRWHIENPESTEAVPEELAIFLNGKPLVKGKQVRLLPRGEMSYISLEFAIQNHTERVVRTLQFRAGVSTPDTINHASDRRSLEYQGVVLKDSRVFMHPTSFSLLPNEWASIEFRLMKKHVNIATGETFPCSLHIYFESGSMEVPFNVVIDNPLPGFTTGD